ncbi:efflux transporter outer membrane subunit [Chitinimonas sp. PSY-7]|uniref:efflux transporter outer membrane subunit n=1 Tax=Chitinimonas sp. PSY-7 TaxID=3459088 RepID=UPI0040401166
MKPFYVLLCAGLLTGCMNTPYQRPPLVLPEQWSVTSNASLPKSADDWWKSFDDPVLFDLITQARLRNPDVIKAAIKLRQAELDAGMEENKAGPAVSASLSGNRTYALNNQGVGSKSATSKLELSYEVDLWGKVDATLRKSRLSWQATRYDEQAARLKLEADAASHYWTLATLLTEHSMNEQALDEQRQLLKLAESRLQHGAASRSDVIQAERALLSAEKALRQTATKIASQRNKLAILLDRPFGSPELRVPPLSLQSVLPAISAGLPAELLSRRPDVMAAEVRLQVELAGIDVARSSFYPTLSLTGELGTRSRSLSSLFQNPTAALGASLSLPFLEFHKRKLEVARQRAAYRLAEVNFRSQLYQALVEVDDNLQSRQQLQKDADTEEQTLKLARLDETLTFSRYRTGEVELKTVLEAQAKRRQAEQMLLTQRRDQLKNLAELFKAVGGAPQG